MHTKYFFYLGVALVYFFHDHLFMPNIWLGCLYLCIFVASIDVARKYQKHDKIIEKLKVT